MQHHTITETSAHFSTDASGLVEARRAEVVEVVDGDVFELRIAPVA